jgi:hypothetical protein
LAQFLQHCWNFFGASFVSFSNHVLIICATIFGHCVTVFGSLVAPLFDYFQTIFDHMNSIFYIVVRSYEHHFSITIWSFLASFLDNVWRYFWRFYLIIFWQCLVHFCIIFASFL